MPIKIRGVFEHKGRSHEHTSWAGMPGNEPKKDDGVSGDNPIKFPNVDREDQLSLPSVPINSVPPAEGERSFAPQEPLQFDRKVREYGEEIKKELVAATKVDFFGNSEWKPYSISVDRIPSEYHDRVAHYLLQAYKLPEAERHVAYNAPAFHNLDRVGLAHALVARGFMGVYALGENLYNFRGVDEQFVLDALLRDGNIWQWIDKVDFFTSIPHRVLVEEILKDPRHSEAVFHNVHKLRLSHDDHKAIAEKVLAGNLNDLEHGISNVHAVAHLGSVVHKMKGLDHAHVLRQVVASSAQGAHAVGARMHLYSGLNSTVLAEACREARIDPRWSKYENGRIIDLLIDYFQDFNSLNQAERAKRLLAINPDYILAHLDEFPSLRHIDVALANLDVDARDYAFFDLMDNLSLSSPDETLVVVEAVMDSPKYGCNDVIRHFDKFPGIDPGLIADKILERNPAAFLGEGKFLGFTASEIFLKLLQRGLPEDDYETVREEGTLQASWIRFGGHGREIAAAFVAVGEGHLVIENLSCFSGLTDTQVCEAVAQAVERCIKQGRVDTARSYLVTHQVSAEGINQRLVEQLRVDMSRQPLSPEAVLRIAGFAAWSLYYPAILEASDVAAFVEPYRKLFGMSTPEQLEKNARQKFLENLVSRGVPMLTQLGWLRPDTLESLSTILPKFLESTTGSHSAWTAHEINLRINTVELETRRRKFEVALRRARQELGTSGTISSIQQRSQEIFDTLDAEQELQRQQISRERAARMAREELGSRANVESLQQRADEIFVELEGFERSNGEILVDHMERSLAEGERGESAMPEEVKRRDKNKKERRRQEGGNSLLVADFSADTADPLVELTTLRNFYRDFGIIQAPELYLREYRTHAVTSHQSRGDSDQGLAHGFRMHALLSELESLHNQLARETPVNIFGGLRLEHLEYLSGWTRIQARSWSDNWGYAHSPNTQILQSRINSFQKAHREGRIVPKDPRLTIRRINVYESSRSFSSDIQWSEALTASYQRTRAVVEQFGGVKASLLYVQERNSVGRCLEEQLQKRREWLAGEEMTSPGSQKVLSGRAQISWLERYLKDLEKVEDSERLIEFLCRVKGPLANSFKGTVLKLAVCMGLERVSDPEELLESLEPLPTERAVRRLYEFIANQVRDAALRPLEREPKILHIAEKHLAIPEFKMALTRDIAPNTGGDGNQRLRPLGPPTEEILVLPTRGVLAELAGYFSEACWTDKEDLMKDHPNLTALIFMKRERATTDVELASGSVDLSDASLLGACYMIQVRDNDGHDVLVVRGINPRARECERLDVESFVEGLLDHVVMPCAEALGVTKIVVPIDEDLGHSLTNRQLINEYVHSRYAKSEYVPLDPKGPNSQFNDRLIFDKCRLVRLLPPRV